MSMFHRVPGVPREKTERFGGLPGPQDCRRQALRGQNITRAKHVV